jgi:hypothetical protein
MDTRIRNGILTVAALAFLPAGVAAQQEDEAAPEGVTAETVAAGKKQPSKKTRPRRKA